MFLKTCIPLLFLASFASASEQCQVQLQYESLDRTVIQLNLHEFNQTPIQIKGKEYLSLSLDHRGFSPRSGEGKKGNGREQEHGFRADQGAYQDEIGILNTGFGREYVPPPYPGLRGTGEVGWHDPSQPGGDEMRKNQNGFQHPVREATGLAPGPADRSADPGTSR